MKHTESKLQEQCVKWFRLQYKDVMIFAIPNGEKRNIITATILKRQGVVAGVPDLFVPEYKLFIEMKSEKGKLSSNQIKFIVEMTKIGYFVEVCRSVEEFVEIINKYKEK